MKRFFPAQSFFISLVIITLILSGITGTIAHYTSDIGAASTQEWSVPVEVLAGSEGGSNILEFGIVLTATDGFDSGVDAIHPPPPPGATFEAYFLITGPLPQLDKDYRGPSSSTSWTLVVRSQSNDIAISWNSAQFPSCISAQMDTGIDVIDMLLQDSLTQPLPAGIHSILITVEDIDQDQDGYTICQGDCDDSNENVNPGAQEVCNGIDDDCDGLIDDDDPDCTGKTTWHEDSDNDGYGNPNVSLDTCDQPAGYVLDDTDCDDSNENVNPGATEICNGIDDDCDGLIDDDDPDCTGKTTWHEDSDNDGYGNPNVSLDTCDQPAGYVLDDTDCDDSNENVNPGATEICNGIDDDCDGNIDEGCVVAVSLPVPSPTLTTTPTPTPTFEPTPTPTSTTTPAPTPTPTPVELDLEGAIDEDGVISEALGLDFADGAGRIDITEGTTALTGDGDPLESLWVQTVDDPPAPTEGHIIGLAFDFGPPGASFDPALIVTVEYDLVSLEGGVAEEDLTFAYFDIETGVWVECECIVDPVTHTLTTHICHFTLFAILSEAPPPSFSLRNLTVSETRVMAGESVTIVIDVTNEREVEATYEAKLKINGAVEATQLMTLAGGTTKSLSFDIVKETLGDYKIEIDDQSVEFTVMAPPVTSVSWSLVITIIFGSIAVGSIFAIAIIWLRSRKPAAVS